MKAILSKKTAFLYCIDSDKSAVIEKVFAPMGISVKAVGEDEYHKPLSALVFGIGKEAEPAERAGTIDEPMMILHGLDRNLLDKAVTALRKNDVIIPLKAITTPTNLSWSSVKVFQNLKEEHKAFKKGLNQQ